MNASHSPCNGNPPGSWWMPTAAAWVSKHLRPMKTWQELSSKLPSLKDYTVLHMLEMHHGFFWLYVGGTGCCPKSEHIGWHHSSEGEDVMNMPFTPTMSWPAQTLVEAVSLGSDKRAWTDIDDKAGLLWFKGLSCSVSQDLKSVAHLVPYTQQSIPILRELVPLTSSLSLLGILLQKTTTSPTCPNELNELTENVNKKSDFPQEGALHGRWWTYCRGWYRREVGIGGDTTEPMDCDTPKWVFP